MPKQIIKKNIDIIFDKILGKVDKVVLLKTYGDLEGKVKIDGVVLTLLTEQILAETKQEFKKVIWAGANEWAEKAYKLNWLNKKQWHDDQEVSSSIANHILKAIDKL